jgi:hypothetical protein
VRYWPKIPRETTGHSVATVAGHGPPTPAVVTHLSSFRRSSSRLAVVVVAFVVAADCVGRSAARTTPPDDGAYLVFRNSTEDEVRVFVYAGERGWFVGNVQAFRLVRLPRSNAPRDESGPGRCGGGGAGRRARSERGSCFGLCCGFGFRARGPHYAIRLDTVGAHSVCDTHVAPAALRPHPSRVGFGIDSIPRRAERVVGDDTVFHAALAPPRCLGLVVGGSNPPASVVARTPRV